MTITNMIKRLGAIESELTDGIPEYIDLLNEYIDLYEELKYKEKEVS